MIFILNNYTNWYKGVQQICNFFQILIVLYILCYGLMYVDWIHYTYTIEIKFKLKSGKDNLHHGNISVQKLTQIST